MSRTQDIWFSFNGVRCDAMGARLAALPMLPVAAEKGEIVPIPGRDGTLFIPEDAFDDVTLKLTIEADRTHTDAVSAWLRGAGELILSPQPDRCLRARVVKGFKWQPGAFPGGDRCAEVTFICAPFRYRPGRPALPDFTRPAAFEGEGTHRAQPVIEVFGSGDVALMVNGTTALIDGVDGSITLDCEALMAFCGDDNASAKLTLLEDAWPYLMPGENTLSWTGNVTRVKITPNWRWR